MRKIKIILLIIFILILIVFFYPKPISKIQNCGEYKINIGKICEYKDCECWGFNKEPKTGCYEFITCYGILYNCKKSSDWMRPGTCIL